MKRTLIALLLCTVLCATVFAQTGNDFEITQNKQGSITITEYKGKATNVIIPSTIEGIKVTEIGVEAFDHNKIITSVTIPNGVTSIGYRAFWYCENLTSVIIPNSVTSIGGEAFVNCILTSVTIPNGVTRIEYKTFEGCTSLASVTIPNGVTSIGSSAFEGCTSLTSVNIPDNVTSIERYAFYECTNLTSVTIPNSVISIGEWAFSGCTSLTSVTIPNSVTSIGDDAFYGCNNLTIITIAANKNYAYRFPNNFSAFYESQGKKAGTYMWSGRLWKIGTAAEAAQILKDNVEAYTFLEGWAVMPEGEFFIQTSNASQGFDRGYWDLDQNLPIKQGAKLRVWANKNEVDNYYHFIPLGDGWYKIAFRQNGLVLDVIDGQNRNGVEIQAYRDNNAQSQRFRFKQTKNGLYKIYTYWGRTIHTQRSDAEDGVVHTWEDVPVNSEYKKNQLWQLVKP